ncbi:DUF3105 domain-containing protein [Nocardia takedensis]|uniref:DUF3105 domain-containing protein n=1 Tax=Nocardia takedensis TaxID=259390 RepID=UPI003F76E482
MLASRRGPSWLLVGAVVGVLVLVGVIAYDLVPKYRQTAEMARFTPDAETPDPSTDIEGVERAEYPPAEHVRDPQRVAYDRSPPMGGPHDQYWAACTGVVYTTALRSENAVHALEHGAVWITYDPQKLSPQDLAILRDKVEGRGYMLMSPYPGQPTRLSLQSWGRQLRLDRVEDPRLDRFVVALRQNPNTHPEPGASCSVAGDFDPDNPPPFRSDPPGPDAIPGAATAAGFALPTS